VPAARGRIHVEAVQDTSGVTTISVEDNGPGVDPVDRDRIFQPFYSSKGAKGTGLGLAVTSKIVAEHAGTLRAERGRLGGARLVMTFPGTGPTDIGPQ
jgi:signal transduction histidine kinase